MSALWIAAVAAGIGWCCAAGLLGLWLGERSRRIGAESFLGWRPPPVVRPGSAPRAAPGPETDEARVLGGRGSMSVEDLTKRVQRKFGVTDADEAEEVARSILAGPPTGS